MTHKANRRRHARYVPPTDNEAMDLLDDAEFKLCGDSERLAITRGRAKAWEMHRASGPSGRLRDLCQGAVDDYVVLENYTRSGQISAMVASISVEEGAHLRCSLERSLVDGSIIGVRVTLAGFTR
jgi:hypothetical protein